MRRAYQLLHFILINLTILFHLEKKEEILSCFEDFIIFCSLLHSTYCSQQKSYLLKLPDDYMPEQCNKIKSVTAGHFKKYTNDIKKKEEKVEDMTNGLILTDH